MFVLFLYIVTPTFYLTDEEIILICHAVYIFFFFILKLPSRFAHRLLYYQIKKNYKN